jgi:microcystin-dependent protein
MSTPFLSEIRIMSFGFPPKGWAQCNGQLLPINQNQALFALLGTTYGGDGRVNFGLPNLQGCVPISMGAGFTLGQVAGEENHTLNISEMAQHNHGMQGVAATADNATPSTILALAQGIAAATGTPPVNLYGNGQPNATFAPPTISNSGGSQPHPNQQPYLVLNFCIALQGIFPSQN